jgi:hypothetical protein
MVQGRSRFENLFTNHPWIAGEGIICIERNILIGNLNILT